MKIHTLLFFCGALSALAMAPYNVWAVLFLTLSILVYFINNANKPFTSAFRAFFFSLGYFGFSLYWIGNALLVEDNPYWWVWPFAVSGLPLILSLFPFTSIYIYKKLFCRSNNTTLNFIGCVCALFLADLARGTLFTGFPWNLYAYTWINIPQIAQVAGLHNIYILHFLTLFWCATPALYFFTKKNFYFALLLAITSFGISFHHGHNILAEKNNTQENYKIKIVQPNIKQSEKWKPENRVNNFMTLLEMSKYSSEISSNSNNPVYIIWPETAISQDLLNSPWAIDLIADTLKGYSSPAYLITGALRYESETDTFFNSIITFNNNGDIIDTYNKSHLVPFGEYIPLENIFDIAPVVGFKGFKAGNGQKLSNIDNHNKFIGLVCYEIIFPVFDKQKYYNSNFIINVTNDAWYGKSAGPYQHLVQSQFRAIEIKKPIIRAANTGISAFINKFGQIIEKQDLTEKGVIYLKN